MPDDVPQYASVHALGEKMPEAIDASAVESADLRARVKAKYLGTSGGPVCTTYYRAAGSKLADDTWAKGTAVRRNAKEDKGKYVLILGVKPGAKNNLPPPLLIEDIESA